MEIECKEEDEQEAKERIGEIPQDKQKEDTTCKLQETTEQSHLQEIESLQLQLSSFIPRLEEVILFLPFLNSSKRTKLPRCNSKYSLFRWKINNTSLTKTR